MTDIVERLRTSTEWAHCKHSMREEAAAEIERLQAHAKSMVDALNADIDAKAAENERLRDNIVQQSRKYEADMKVMQLALNREIEARRALERKP